MGTRVDQDSQSLGGWILDSSSSDDSELSGEMIRSLGFFFSDLIHNDGFTALRLEGCVVFVSSEDTILFVGCEDTILFVGCEDC